MKLNSYFNSIVEEIKESSQLIKLIILEKEEFKINEHNMKIAFVYAFLNFYIKIKDKPKEKTGKTKNKTERLAKLEKLSKILYKEFEYNKPCAVCIESPFYSSRTPSAFGSIKEITEVVKNALNEYDNSLLLLSIDPPTVKKSVKAKGNHDKDHVKEKVINIYKEIENIGDIDLLYLDEHSIDSLAICYGVYDHVFYHREE